MHGLEVLHLTSNTAANPGRCYYKCAHPSEGHACLRFKWVDEWDAEMGNSSAGGRHGNLGRCGHMNFIDLPISNTWHC